MTNPNKHGTQKQRILHYLMSNPNKKIPCYHFAINMKIMRYWARLDELKHEGHNIQNEITYNKKQKHSNWIYIPNLPNEK